MDSIRIFAGLGNPGAEYEKTYHNAGKIALSELYSAFKERFPEYKEGSYKGFAYIKFPGAVLLYPEAYMNESGQAIKDALKYFEAGPENLIVLHDDSDLPFGEVKESFGSGAAGHHGIESIIAALGTKDFARIRIGIRKEARPAAPREKAGDFVLKHLSPEDQDLLRTKIQEFTRKVIRKE